MLKEDLIVWQSAVDAFERGDLNATVDGFNTITECGSRISFNLGVIYASIDRHEDAIVSFTNATIQDPYLAVAFVQLATSQWMMGDYDSAIEALSNAYLCMRGNLSIAYAQLGLDYTLFSFEILFNRILCYLTIGKWDDAMNDWKLMQTQRVEPEHSSSDFEWETLRERVENGTIDEIAFFSVPAGAMYRPPEMKVNNTGKIDFLGKSQVISSLDAADTFVGFVGAKVQAAMQEAAEPLDISKSETIPNVHHANVPANDEQMNFEQLNLNERSNSREAGNNLNATGSALGRKPSLFVETRAPFMDHDGMASPGKYGRRPSTRTNGPTTSLARSSSRPSMGSPNLASRGLSNQTPQTPLSAPIQGNSRFDPGTPTQQLASSFSALPSSVASALQRPPSAYNTLNGLPSNRPSSDEGSLPSGVGRIKMKCHHGNDTRIVMFSSFATYKDIEAKLRTKFNLGSAIDLNIKYKDDEGELVCLNDDEDLELALSVVDEGGFNTGVYRLEVFVCE